MIRAHSLPQSTLSHLFIRAPAPQKEDVWSTHESRWVKSTYIIFFLASPSFFFYLHPPLDAPENFQEHRAAATGVAAAEAVVSPPSPGPLVERVNEPK
ncbi:hypothetical protein Bpfe_007377 [Biomphalaria pfeifferi]|uniref:Uncharacterized protein n=1 Tax=Biomphalaria pfeifferi TaxID=112525 RepID=A0AAD8BYR6_BIOPF|nr:hypothetical protein Bpfe_007377 [Biomphalaria pfeifferi]